MDQAAERKAEAAPVLPQAVGEALRRGCIVVSAGQRAARALHQAFDRDMQASGAGPWVPPDIFSLDSWMASLWRQLTLNGTARRLLLNPSQEHTLWRAILAADQEVSGLASVDALAEMAASTWRLLCLRGGRSRLNEAAPSPDSRAFQRWAKLFEQTAAKGRYMSGAELPQALTSAVEGGGLPVPNAGLLLVDFDSIAPAHAELFEALRRAGFEVAEHQTSAKKGPRQICEAGDESTELEGAAAWIRDRLQADPGTRIAVVVPNLRDRWAEMTRVFGRVLHSDLVSSPPGRPARKPVFEFSLGHPLAETPMVAAALDLLRWTLGALPIPSVSALLLSPHFGLAGTPAERLALAEFDAHELCKMRGLRPVLSLDAAVRLLEVSPRRSRIASLLRCLQSVQQTAEAEGLHAGWEQQSFADWSDAFRKLLEAAGWTASANRSSLAFQTHRRFESALDELATLDFEGSPVDAQHALAALERIVQRIIFAPESREALVQIVGPLEVGGVPFDALWFLGAGDLLWPQTPTRTPLLSWQVQRSLALPGVDAERDHAAACRLTERIAGSATQVVFSFAARGEDGEQRRSPALAGFALEPFHPRARDTRMPLALERFADRVPIAPLPDRITPGGARVLELQAACAFRAFAEFRLGSTEPGVPSLGFDPLQRGNLVHKVMELFWREIGGQEKLSTLTPEQREEALALPIAEALERDMKRADGNWDEIYLRTQRDRLQKLLRPWIDLELRRPAFSVRSSEKALHDVQLGRLRLQLRVDRIDETATGAVILDYKTGEANPAQWMSDRPDAPQLPLYAVLSKEPIVGLAFALLRAGDGLALKGFAGRPEVFGKVARMAHSMQDQVEEWCRTLESLASAFARGDARVLPKAYPKTCKHCSQRILCRLDPAIPVPVEEDEEGRQDRLHGGLTLVLEEEDGAGG